MKKTPIILLALFGVFLTISLNLYSMYYANKSKPPSANNNSYGSKICPHCGHKNRPSSSSCRMCGRPLGA